MIHSENYILGVKKSFSGKTWVGKPSDARHVLSLCQTFGLSEVIANLLVSRDVSPDNVAPFLNPSLRHYLPDPTILKDMDKAVARVVQAIKNKEKITVFGDYDVDGATSSATLHRFFSMIPYPLDVYIPDRMDEGYGPNIPAFDSLQSQGCQLVITVDCGTAAQDVLEHASQKGLDVIVLDHHTAPAKLPPAVAIVNPNRLDESQDTRVQLGYCAAVGIAFLFSVALNRALRTEGYYKRNNTPDPDLLSLLDLVALGTVCDVMPLTGINRAFVTQGLKVLAKRQNLGLRTLCDIAGVNEPPKAYHLGFVIGPRINAGGRVGQASLGSQLLRTSNEHIASRAANDLERFNQERKQIEAGVLGEALMMAEDNLHPFLLVGKEHWHPGVIGIVAGRLKEKYHRPACVVAFDADGVGKGSGRSIPGLDLGAFIHSAYQAGILEGGGGHPMAAGFTILKQNMAVFHDFMLEKLQHLPPLSGPSLVLDGVLSFKGATADFIREVDRLAPFGVGNPSPKFAFDHIRLSHIDVLKGSHLRCQFTQMDGTRMKAMAFRSYDTPLGQRLLDSVNQTLHIAGTLKIDDWQGKDGVQLMLDDAAKPHEAD